MCNRLTVQASSMRVLCENDVKWLSNYRWVKTTCSFQNRRRSECLWAIASESRWPRSCRAPQATSPPRRKTCHWTVAARSRPASSATWPAGWRRFVAPTQRAKAALCFEVCRRGVLPLLWNRQAGAHETLGKRFCSGSSRNKLPDSAGGDRDNHGSTQMRKRCIFVLAHLSLQSSRLSCAFYLPFVAARQLSHISWVVESPGTTGPALLLRFWSDVCVQLARTALVNLICVSLREVSNLVLSGRSENRGSWLWTWSALRPLRSHWFSIFDGFHGITRCFVWYPSKYKQLNQ